MDEEMGLSLGDIAKALKKRLVLLIVIPIVFALLVNWYVQNSTVDMYTAQVKLYTLFDYVDNTGTVRYDLSSSAYFVSDYRELIQTNEVIAETCNRLGWPYWPSGMSVGVGSVQDTRLITVSVTSPYPEMSMQAANTLATVFAEYIHNLLQTDSIRVASEAALPTYPSNGGRGSYAVMAYLAALVGLAFVVVALEVFNTKVRSDGDADVKLHVNVLSSIMAYKKEMTAYIKKHKARETSLLACVNENTQESIRKLALNVQFAAMGAPLETLTVTSTSPSEGKSSVSLMLASEMASQGKQVLIVDMDYRSPMIGRYLGRRNKKDVMDYLGGNATLQEAVSKTNVPNLFFMDNHHRIAVNAGSPAFDRLIQEGKEYFDLILFDTAPLGVFIDAAPLAAKSDGTLVIVADGKIDRKDLKKVLDQLEQVKAKMLGIAFNFVQQKEKKYYSYNKYYRYGSHRKSERRATKELSEGADQNA